MRRSILAIASASLLSCGLANAADMPVKARPLPPPPPVFSWTGFYIGAHVGGAWGTTESTLNSVTVDISCRDLIATGTIEERVITPCFDVVRADTLLLNGGLNGGGILGTHVISGLSIPISQTQTNGFLGGVQGGYNWQFAPWGVIGVEAQFSWTDLKGTSPCVVVLACSTEHDWITTLAGRFGVTYDRLLLYVKGGVAWSKVTYSASLTLGSPFDFTTSVSDTRVGAMFGTGVEYAFWGNWSAKIEYDYIRFKDKDYTFPLAFTAGPFNVNLNFDTTIKEHIHLVKAGLNYRFDWGKGPVAVRAAY
jgi:outer membrane immunogenic protein